MPDFGLTGRNNGGAVAFLSWEKLIPAALETITYDLYRSTLPGDPVNARNEKQTVLVDATGGTFTLTWGGHTTAPLAWDIAAADLETALTALFALSSVGATCAVSVAAVVGHPTQSVYTVEFTGAVARTDVAQMTGSATSLTGGASTLTISTVQTGLPPHVLDVATPYLEADTSDTLYYYALRARSNQQADRVSNEIHIFEGTGATDTPESGPPLAVRSYLAHLPR